MAKFNKPNGTNKSIGMLVVTLIFLILGIVCIVIGFKNDIVSWMKTFGIAVCVLASPIIIFIIFRFIMSKIERL